MRSRPPRATPTGSAGRTVSSYPIVPESTPTWASGVVAAAGTAAERAHADTVRSARRAKVSVAAVTLAPKTWTELAPTSAVKAALRGSVTTKVISAPLLPTRGATLTACSKGDYRTQWEGFARALADAGIASPVLDLGDPGAATQPEAFAACYRQVAAAVRGVLPKARMQWTVDRTAMNPSSPRGAGGPTSPTDLMVAWPGDGVVDILGIDSLDTGDNWSKTVNGEGGLNWWSDFASDRKARIALSGWGPAPGSAASAGNGAYVQNVHDWLSRMARRGLLAYDLYSEPSASRGGSAANVYRALF